MELPTKGPLAAHDGNEDSLRGDQPLLTEEEAHRQRSNLDILASNDSTSIQAESDPSRDCTEAKCASALECASTSGPFKQEMTSKDLLAKEKVETNTFKDWESFARTSCQQKRTLFSDFLSAYPQTSLRERESLTRHFYPYSIRKLYPTTTADVRAATTAGRIGESERLRSTLPSKEALAASVETDKADNPPSKITQSSGANSSFETHFNEGTSTFAFEGEDTAQRSGAAVPVSEQNSFPSNLPDGQKIFREKGGRSKSTVRPVNGNALFNRRAQQASQTKRDDPLQTDFESIPLTDSSLTWNLHPRCLGPLPQKMEKSSSRASELSSKGPATARRLGTFRAATASASLSPQRMAFRQFLDETLSIQKSENFLAQSLHSKPAFQETPDFLHSREIQREGEEAATVETAAALMGLKLLKHRLQTRRISSPLSNATPSSPSQLSSRNPREGSLERSLAGEASAVSSDLRSPQKAQSPLLFSNSDAWQQQFHLNLPSSLEQMSVSQTQMPLNAMRRQETGAVPSRRHKQISCFQESPFALGSLCLELRSLCADFRRQLEMQQLKIEALEEGVSTLKRQHQLSYELLVQQRKETDALEERQDRQEKEMEQQLSAIWRHQQSLSILQHRVEDNATRCAKREVRLRRLEERRRKRTSTEAERDSSESLEEAECRSSENEVPDKLKCREKEASELAIKKCYRDKQVSKTQTQKHALQNPPQIQTANTEIANSDGPETKALKSEGNEETPLVDAILSQDIPATTQTIHLSEETLLARINSLKRHVHCAENCSHVSEARRPVDLSDIASSSGAPGKDSTASAVRSRFRETASRSNASSSANEFKSTSSIFSFPSIGSHQVASEGSSPQCPYIWKTEKGTAQLGEVTNGGSGESKEICESPKCDEDQMKAKTSPDLIPKLRLALTPPRL